jgi:hypothetical protein
MGLIKAIIGYVSVDNYRISSFSGEGRLGGIFVKNLRRGVILK